MSKKRKLVIIFGLTAFIIIVVILFFIPRKIIGNSIVIEDTLVVHSDGTSFHPSEESVSSLVEILSECRFQRCLCNGYHFNDEESINIFMTGNGFQIILDVNNNVIYAYKKNSTQISTCKDRELIEEIYHLFEE